MERICKKCGETKPIEEFVKSPTCRYGQAFCCFACNHKYGKLRYERTKPEPKPKLIRIEKVCSKCGKKYPLTEEYFFIKKCKHKLANGDIKEYKMFRWVCKKCHGKLGEDRRINKRCIELVCKPSDYGEAWKKHMAKAKTLYPELNIPLLNRTYVLKKIRKGYRYTTYDQYKKDCQNNYMLSAKRRRVYDYGDVDLLTNDMKSKMAIKMMPDARLAQIMGMSVHDVPKELIEIKRLITILKREAGLTHSTKPNKK